MAKKVKVGILFGGRSAEHEVSLLSAKNILEAIDKNKYEPVLIGIDKAGRWHLNQAQTLLQHQDLKELPLLDKADASIALIPGDSNNSLTKANQSLGSIDVVFPIMHGTYGEDGTIQGLLKILDIPFVGAGVLGSAVGMDKDVMKRLLRDAGLPIGKFITIRDFEKENFNYEQLSKELGSPFFIKPANAGSSVGVHKISQKEQFVKAAKDAFQYDRKILAEEFIKGREIECSVLGGDHPIASSPGELITTHEFYSYEAKYVDENGASFQIPAQLPKELAEKIKKVAIEAFQVLCSEGMARVDFFLTVKNEIYINEINTIPGFTRISMYPKMWEASGVSARELVDRLIQHALERHKKENALKLSYTPSEE